MFAGPGHFLSHKASSCLDTYHKIDPLFILFYIIYITIVLKLEPLTDAPLGEISYGYHQYSRSVSRLLGLDLDLAQGGPDQMLQNWHEKHAKNSKK
jgi:hypothetical protein